MTDTNRTNTFELTYLAQQYLQCLLTKDKQMAEKVILNSLQDGFTVKRIYLEVFQPVQWEIGRLWQHNIISVAMEHYCTAATQFIMSRLYEFLFAESTAKKGLSMVATSVSGELHELGIRMVTDFFEMDGWDTYYLGASTNKEGILEMLKECKADLLAISATIFFNVPQVEELISFIRKEIPKNNVKIIVGGKAFSTKKNLWKNIGADLFAGDAQNAIVKCNNALLKV